MRSKEWNPLENVDTLDEPPPTDDIVIWESDEIPKLFEAADKRKDGIAAYIGVLAGLRRSEIVRLEWQDITEAFIIVRKSKTVRERQVPLSNRLAKRLAKEKRRGVKVVQWPDNKYGWIAAARDFFDVYMARELPELFKNNPEKFSWNPLRHTFASRLAQKGHSLELISYWLGDSPRVCKRHYARFVPANRRDTRIDDVDL